MIRYLFKVTWASRDGIVSTQSLFGPYCVTATVEDTEIWRPGVGRLLFRNQIKLFLVQIFLL